MQLECIADQSFFERLSGIARRALHEATPSTLAITNKSDSEFDPVTSADRAIEQALRQAVQTNFPNDSISGEELGGVSGSADRYWSIDPIDGTRAFICGLSSWSVLVGLVEDGRHIASMIDLPATSELFIAADGVTTCNGSPVHTSGQTALGSARLSTTDPFLFGGAEFEAFDRVRRSVLLTRYGLDGSAYARVASGGLDLVIESGLKRWDYYALIPVVRFAGGHIGDWAGGEDFASGRIIAAASKELYDCAVEIMREAV